MKRGKKRQKVDTIEKLASVIEKLASAMAEGFFEISLEFQDVCGDLKGVHAELTEVNRRLDSLEEHAERQAGYAKETDHFFGRMSRIEKHIKFA